jgi:hypothetical protein
MRLHLGETIEETINMSIEKTSPFLAESDIRKNTRKFLQTIAKRRSNDKAETKL